MLIRRLLPVLFSSHGHDRVLLALAYATAGVCCQVAIAVIRNFAFVVRVDIFATVDARVLFVPLSLLLPIVDRVDDDGLIYSFLPVLTQHNALLLLVLFL